MREIRPSGSEGGVAFGPLLPLSRLRAQNFPKRREGRLRPGTSDGNGRASQGKVNGLFERFSRGDCGREGA